MKTFILSCLILPFTWIISDASYKPKDYRLGLNYTKSSTSNTCHPGIFCQNCRDRYECTTDGNQKYLETCPPGKICVDGECTIPPTNPPCSPISDFQFICAAVGVFPDPADCKYYHMCARSDPHNTNEPFIHIRIRCEGLADEFGYNPKTTICDRKLVNKTCGGYPIPLCKGYEASALAENPTLFYVCKERPHMLGVLYPHQSRCFNGEIFYAPGKACIEKSLL